MPIGSSKLGVLGAGLVPGGTETFNAPGTFSIPPGVKKVSITGVGGSGNPGVAGNAGTPGNPGTGGTGGGSGRSYTGCSSVNGAPGGGSWNTAIICSPLVNVAPPFPNNDNTTGFHPRNTNPTMTPFYRVGGAGFFFDGTPYPSQAGQGGSGGNAGSAGTAGTAGNIGQSSSALCNTFPGGAAGNAPPGGNAGNAGTAGTGGGAGNVSTLSANGNSASGGNGGGAGGATSTTLCNTNFPPAENHRLYGAGGGGGAGISNDGQTGQATIVTTPPNPPPPCVSGPRYSFGGTWNGGSTPLFGCPTNYPPASNKVGPSSSTQSIFNPYALLNTPGNTIGGTGAHQAGRHAITTIGPRCITSGAPPSNDLIVRVNAPLGYAPPAPPGCVQNLPVPVPRRWLTAWNPAPLRPEVFRAGAGGGGAGLPFCGANSCGRVRSGGAGGGGGRGNAGNAGGPSPTISGQVATPATFNCVPVTPGGTAPITVGSPGGQIVISWNPQ
jgi:hypothetical protein